MMVCEKVFVIFTTLESASHYVREKFKTLNNLKQINALCLIFENEELYYLYSSKLIKHSVCVLNY